jgi:hypothetical protein
MPLFYQFMEKQNMLAGAERRGNSLSTRALQLRMPDQDPSQHKKLQNAPSCHDRKKIYANCHVAVHRHDSHSGSKSRLNKTSTPNREAFE